VTEGVARVREIIAAAERRRADEGRGTILFCDEIHRFNKAQQDAFLPWVERGVVTLIGATTENPSFELTSALLSRLRVFVLEPLRPEDIRDIIGRALDKVGAGPAVTAEALEKLVVHADGDARRALTTLEAVLEHRARTPGAPIVTPAILEEVLSRRLPRYDKSGEEHYNLISALHKAVRGSDPDAALYWLARMLNAGEDPLYLARRIVRIASEDIGLADPRALSISLAAKEAYAFLGSPEGELALAEAVIYLAAAPKSNRVYEAWGGARQAAEEHPSEPVPLHIRNAPTGLMKGLGYGKGYRYDHAEEGALAAGQQYLPDALKESRWYEPSGRGLEAEIGKRLERWAEMRRRNDQEQVR
jgi:putative ATPase